MDCYHSEDTAYNLHLNNLRKTLYECIGVAATDWMVKFENLFYKILNCNDDGSKRRFAITLHECILDSLQGEQLHYQDVIERFKNYAK